MGLDINWKRKELPTTDEINTRYHCAAKIGSRATKITARQQRATKITEEIQRKGILFTFKESTLRSLCTTLSYVTGTRCLPESETLVSRS